MSDLDYKAGCADCGWSDGIHAFDCQYRNKYDSYRIFKKPQPSEQPEQPAEQTFEMPTLAWEYRGDGLYIYWNNPFDIDQGGKQDVAMFMWPTHSPETTATVEQVYEAMAENFVSAWNAAKERSR
jgi:hypothetical protein